MQNKHFKVAICATTLLFSLSAFGFQAQIGVDESNLSAKPEAVRAQVLAGVKQLGATWFRDAFTSKAKGGVADWGSFISVDDSFDGHGDDGDFHPHSSS